MPRSAATVEPSTPSGIRAWIRSVFGRGQQDYVFPPEVLDLKARGVPYPTWFSGPLFPRDGAEAAKEQYAEYVRTSSDEEP